MPTLTSRRTGLDLRNVVAAAPDLYEALDRLVDLLGNYVGWGQCDEENAAEDAARKALAKARGKTN